MKSLLQKTTVFIALVLASFAGQQVYAQTYVVDPLPPYGYGTTPYYYQDYSYYSGGYDQSALIQELTQLLQQLQSQQSYGGSYSYPYGYYGDQYTYLPTGSGYYDDYYYYGDRHLHPDVHTDTAKSVRDDSAELKGHIHMNDFNNGIVFFVYGQDENMIEDVERDYDTYEDVKDDEEHDDFEVERVDRDLDGDDSYEEKVTNLEDNQDYFFVICVEYDDEDSDETLMCGRVQDFETDNSNNDDEPEADTQSAANVDNNSARLRGEVDMNDFEDGKVFFVWGEDENQVEDVEDEDRYTDIDEDGDDLQKEVVDNNLDGHDSYDLEIYGLDGNTDHYFRICVEYDDNSNDETLECGDVEQFETD